VSECQKLPLLDESVSRTFVFKIIFMLASFIDHLFVMWVDA
jgi:hypothetical protein